MTLARQRSFDDLGAPLPEVSFCVVDIETTGGSPAECGITEIAAARFRAGVPDGTFQTLVNPGMPVPPFITILTGITDAMVSAAPPLQEVIPSFLEFMGDAVLVGHNIRFDLSFINAAAESLGYGRIPNRSVDTLALARRLVRGDVRDLRLGTLAAHFRSPVTPNHRALDDVHATAHVLWSLLEMVGRFGVTHLDDLLTLPTARGSPHYPKIELTASLPRLPGVYSFMDRNGEVFYVGKAKDLRSRVRSYFYGDGRRRVDTMLRELHRIEHRVCATELEAEVTELRLIAAHRPRHNRRSRPGAAAHWVRLTDEAFPRLSVVRRPDGPGTPLFGPFRGLRAARTVVEAIWDALPIRRCTGAPATRSAPCAAAQLGTAMCPCDGSLDPAEYRHVVECLLTAVGSDPSPLLDPLADGVATLAAAERYEEAGWRRDRHHALALALERRRAWTAMQAAGTIHAVSGDGRDAALIERGRLVAAWADGCRPLFSAAADPGAHAPALPTDLTDAEEARLVWRWLTSGRVVLVEATGLIAEARFPVRSLDGIAV